MSVKVKYKGEQILSLNTDTEKALSTMGQYCEDDITIENVQDGGITPSGTLPITENGTYDVTEYASADVNVSGGTEIETGIVVKTLDSDLRIKEADVYFGDIVPYGFKPMYMANNAPVGSITFHGKPKIIGEYAFNAFSDCSGLDTSEVTTIRNRAFASAHYVGAKTFPKCTLLNGQYHFWECTSVTSLDFPILTATSQSAFGKCTALQNFTIGSVGHKVTVLVNSTFASDTQANLTITIYTDGAYADTALANARNGATNATIIIKASEDTTYNGVSYSAGETMITSEVA